VLLGNAKGQNARTGRKAPLLFGSFLPLDDSFERVVLTLNR